MNGDLISREAALNLARSFTMHEGEDVLGRQVDMVGADDIKGLPAVDAVPVRHGRWHRHRVPARFGGVRIECSVCTAHGDESMNYCPHCGAKMDGGSNV